LSKIKFFIAHGESDNVIKIEEAQKSKTFLKEKKVLDLTYKTYAMPHSISGDELNDLRGWLSKAIKPAEKKVEPKNR
jgi:phospholipase/carboxylesterase